MIRTIKYLVINCIILTLLYLIAVFIKWDFDLNIKSWGSLYRGMFIFFLIIFLLIINFSILMYFEKPSKDNED